MVQSPVAGRVNLAMRRFVAEAGRRRMLPASFHVGHPDGERADLVDLPWYDAGLRADLVTRAIDGVDVPDPLPWVTRSGELEPTDEDLRWLAATREAFERHALPLPGFFVVTRRGWCDLVGGQVHTWVRVRPRRHRD